MADGYWPRIVDRDSAVGALRMAGLPVFLIGASTFLLGAVIWLTVLGSGLQVTTTWVPLNMLVIGAVLVILGFGLRRGRAALVPFAVFLTLANAVVTALVAPWWAMIVQVMMVLVALSGLRGWWWLRKNPA